MIVSSPADEELQKLLAEQSVLELELELKQIGFGEGELLVRPLLEAEKISQPELYEDISDAARFSKVYFAMVVLSAIAGNHRPAFDHLLSLPHAH